MLEVRIEKNSEGQRIEKFVRKYLNEAPLGFIYKAFRKKDIKINGHWVNKEAIIHEGDIVRIYVTDQQLEDFKKPRKAEKKEMPHEIVYEDENVLLINKPKGLLVYGDDKGSRETLGNAVLDYLYLKGEYDPNNSSFTPSPAHRLDRNTSGLVIYGKNDAALKQLTDLFKEREDIHKTYLALVVGKIDEKGEINKPLKKLENEGRVIIAPLEKGGKTAMTRYRRIKLIGDYSLVEVSLITGRTHQIRVHMASIGHPIVGDNKYGDFQDCRKWKKYGLESQFLHAYKLSFGKIGGTLSNLSEKSFEAKMDKSLLDIIDTINKNN